MSHIKIFFITVSILYGSCSDNNVNEEMHKTKQKEGNMSIENGMEVMQVSQIKYRLKFETDFNKINAGENINLKFRPVFNENINDTVILETIHERKAHLIVVSEDLEYFSHIHPIKETYGFYSVETSLPYGGKYRMFAEYKPKYNEKITDFIDFFVIGKNKSEKIYESQNTVFNGKEFSVKLLNAENLIAGNDSRIVVEFWKDDENISIDKFENYLGEKAHAVAISLGDKNFMHIHPMVMDSKLNLHLNFDKAEYYRLWLQFKMSDQVYTADFVVKVNPSDKNETKNNQHNHH